MTRNTKECYNNNEKEVLKDICFYNKKFYLYQKIENAYKSDYKTEDDRREHQRASDVVRGFGDH